MRDRTLIINTCEICGTEFVGRIPSKPYKACNDPECRLELRRRRGKEQGEKARKRAAESQKRVCLKCGKSFPSLGPSNRICENCRGLNREVYHLVDWVGAA